MTTFNLQSQAFLSGNSVRHGKFAVDAKSAKYSQVLALANIHRQQEFEEAAQLADDIYLKELFRDLGRRRAQNADELCDYLTAASRSITVNSIITRLHRGWIHAKRVVTGTGVLTLLGEAAQAEGSLENQYRRALEQVTNKDLREVMSRQYRGVKAGHDRVTSLRDCFLERSPRD